MQRKVMTNLHVLSVLNISSRSCSIWVYSSIAKVWALAHGLAEPIQRTCNRPSSAQVQIRACHCVNVCVSLYLCIWLCYCKHEYNIWACAKHRTFSIFCIHLYGVLVFTIYIIMDCVELTTETLLWKTLFTPACLNSDPYMMCNGGWKWRAV